MTTFKGKVWKMEVLISEDEQIIVRDPTIRPYFSQEDILTVYDKVICKK